MQRFFLKKNIKLSLRAVFIEHRKGLITLSNLEQKCIRNNQMNIYVKYLTFGRWWVRMVAKLRTLEVLDFGDKKTFQSSRIFTELPYDPFLGHS